MHKPSFLRHNYLYVFGLIVLVTGLPLSLFLISLSQFILAGSFFLEGNFIEKFKRFFNNKAALLIAGIWCMHLAGMLWTSDLAQGWNDIRIKLPVLVLTVLISGSEPLTRKQFFLVLSCFVAAVFIGSMVSMAVLAGFTDRQVLDIRDVFIFKISHIRFGLFTCISIFALLYFIFIDTGTGNRLHRALALLLALWLFLFLFIVESLTGLTILITIFVLLFFSYLWKGKTRNVKIALIAAFFIIPSIAIYVLNKTYKEKYAPRQIFIDVNAKTEQGNPYTFDFKARETENGFPTYVYMCDEELKREWEKRSTLNFYANDKKEQPVKFTLIRFLTSKGLRKDSAAMAQLSDADIRSIENGITNADYQSPSILARLFLVKWEFDQSLMGGDPNGRSIMQRIESWKASMGVVRSHLFFGVGTGDLPTAVHDQYAIQKSRLNPKHYLRAHNQYLAIAGAFGITGLAFFLWALLYPLFAEKQKKNFLYLVFLATLLLSMLTEDTLETQPGATFFAFFNALFLYAFPTTGAKE